MTTNPARSASPLLHFSFLCVTTLFKVLMKDITTPVPPEEMKKIVQKCLEKAALINYTQLTDYAQFEGFICIILHHSSSKLRLTAKLTVWKVHGVI